jgi:integrase
LKYQHTAALRTTLADLYAPATANKMLAALRRVLKECWQLGLMTVEEYERAANVKAGKASTIPQRPGTLARGAGPAARSLRSGRHPGRRQRCRADCPGGPRRSEVVALMLADYDRADGRLTIRSGKGKKDRTIYVQGRADRA